MQRGSAGRRGCRGRGIRHPCFFSELLRPLHGSGFRIPVEETSFGVGVPELRRPTWSARLRPPRPSCEQPSRDARLRPSHHPLRRNHVSCWASLILVEALLKVDEERPPRSSFEQLRRNVGSDRRTPFQKGKRLCQASPGQVLDGSVALAARACWAARLPGPRRGWGRSLPVSLSR